MGVYTTTKCGNCKKYWELFSYGRRGKIGSPIVKCRSCNSLNRTNLFLYRDSSRFTRIWFWTERTFESLFFSILGFLLGGSLLLSDKFSAGEDIPVFLKFIGIGIISFSFYGLYNFFNIKKNMSEIEKTFDNNGGFLWSDQQYDG